MRSHGALRPQGNRGSSRSPSPQPRATPRTTGSPGQQARTTTTRSSGGLLRPQGKKTPQPKRQAQAKPLAKAPTKDELLAEDKEGNERLQAVLKEVFTCYDTDEDGRLERVEFLDGEGMKAGALCFGVKERRAAMAWFKAAGAEGDVQNGMYLAFEKFAEAYAARASETSSIPKEKPADLAAWILEDAKGLIAATYKAPASSSGEAAPEAAAPVEPPPTYPVTCALKQLCQKTDQARKHGRFSLVLTSGLSEVETFLSYRSYVTIDCKQILGETLLSGGDKEKKTAEWQATVRSKLEFAMNNHGMTTPVHIRMNNSAFDWTRFCCDVLPEELFSCTLWTIDNALKHGFIGQAQKMNLEIENEKKWNEFHILISSTFDLDKANEYLYKVIPHFDELAIICIDPASVA